MLPSVIETRYLDKVACCYSYISVCTYSTLKSLKQKCHSVIDSTEGPVTDPSYIDIRYPKKYFIQRHHSVIDSTEGSITDPSNIEWVGNWFP